MINYTLFIGLGFLILCVYAQVRPPNFSPDSIPETSFTCEDKITGGYYADVEADCQLFHVCVQVSEFEFQDFRFLCPNDTVFDQQNLVCTNWFEVDCAQSVSLFSNDFGFKDLSGHNNDEDADNSNFNYNEGISYEYYEYESENQDEERNRFLVNSSPASLGVGREHGQGILGVDGKIRPHSTTAIPVGVTTTKRPPRVKSNINLAKNHPKKHGGLRRKPSSRFRNPFKNPPKKAADGRRPRVKSDLRQRHHGGNFADPIDNDIFSGPEVRPDGRAPRVKSNINAIENNNNIPSGSFSSSTPHAFHFIPTEPTTEAFQPTPFENEESFNTIEFSSDLFPSSTSQPFIPQHNVNENNINQRHRGSSHTKSNFNEQHRSNGVNEVRSFNRQSSFNTKNVNRFLDSTTKKPFIASTTQKPFGRSSTVQPPIISSTTRKPFVSSTTQRSFVSSQSTTFKVPFVSQEPFFSSTSKPFIQDSRFKVPFITKENNLTPLSEARRDKFRVPFLSKQDLSPPKGSKNFRPPFVTDKQKFSNNQQTRTKLSSSKSSKLRPPFISNEPNSIGTTIQPSTFNQRFSTTKSSNFNEGFSTTKSDKFNQESSRSSSNFNQRFSTSAPRSKFNTGFSKSSLNSNQGFSTVSPSRFDQRFSALANSFSTTTSSSSGFRQSSTTKRSIFSTTESPFKGSTSGSFFNVAFTTRSPGSNPRVKSNVIQSKEFVSGTVAKSQTSHQSTSKSHSSHQSTFNSPNTPKFIDEIDEFEVPQSAISPLPFVTSTTARPQKTRKRVTVRRKVVRKNRFGNNVRAQVKNQPSQNFNRQNAQNFRNAQSVNQNQVQRYPSRISEQKEEVRSQGLSQHNNLLNSQNSQAQTSFKTNSGSQINHQQIGSQQQQNNNFDRIQVNQGSQHERTEGNVASEAQININSQKNSQTQKSFKTNAESQVNHQSIDSQQQENNKFHRVQDNLGVQHGRTHTENLESVAFNAQTNINSQNSQEQKSFKTNAKSQVNHQTIDSQKQPGNTFHRPQVNLRTQQGRTQGQTFRGEASSARTKLPQRFAHHEQGSVSRSRILDNQENKVLGTQKPQQHNPNNNANFNLQEKRTKLRQQQKQHKKTFILDEDESFNDITAPGSVKEKECNNPFECPPKKRAGGHRPRVKSNIKAKNRNFHFKHKLGRKIQDSNTITRNNIKPTPKVHPHNFVQEVNRPVKNTPKPHFKAQQQSITSKPPFPKGKLPNKPLSKNQFLSFLSNIGNASPIITVNSKTGKLSTIPGGTFPNGFSGSTKGISSSSIQNKIITTTSSIHSTSQPFFFAPDTTLKPGSRTSLSSTFSRNSFQSSPRPSLSKSNINEQFQSSPRPRLSNSFSSTNNNNRFHSSPSPTISSTSSFIPKNRFTSGPNTFASNSNIQSSPRPKLSSSSFNSINRFQSSPRPSLVSTTERFIASSTVLSISTTPSNGGQNIFIGSTTHSPQFSSPRSPPRSRFNGFRRSKSRRNRPAPFTKTFSSTSGATFPSSTTQVSSVFVAAAENEIIPISTTESPNGNPRVKSNILLAQRNSGRRSRKIGGRRADFGDSSSELDQIKKSSTEDEHKKKELFFCKLQYSF
nr:myb-like protein P [Lepeophtheirus salmonis]